MQHKLHENYKSIRKQKARAGEIPINAKRSPHEALLLLRNENAWGEVEPVRAF